MFYFDDKIIPSPQIEASPLICSASKWWFLYDKDVRHERIKKEKYLGVHYFMIGNKVYVIFKAHRKQ